MTANNVNKLKDRNGLLLEYGDSVFIKTHWKHMYLFTIVGFAKDQVACLCGDNIFYRKSTNVVKVTNPKTWKVNW